ncbi:MAG: hypothetical protein IPJ60_06025 [Sphingobacteriaceae bacterium]|nr:hypothetical protein [Sphingobacteriaceae bacterium]
MKKLVVFLLALLGFDLCAQLKPYYDKKQSYWGYKDSTTGKSIHAGYITAFNFKNGYAVVEEHDRIILINKDGDMHVVFNHAKIINGTPRKMFFVNDSVAGEYLEDGTLVKETRFKQAYKCPNFGDFFVLKDGNRVGFFDMYKGLVLPMEYETQNFESTFNADGDLYFSEKARFCLKHNGKWGIIDPYVETILPFEYDYLVKLDTLFGACKNGKCGVINERAFVRIPFIYETFLGRYSSHGFYARKEDPFIFMDKGKIIFYRLDINKVVDKVPASENEWGRLAMMTVYDQQGKVGLVDTVGKILIPIEFDGLNSSNEKGDQFDPFWIACKDKKCGVYERSKGYKIVPFECENIQTGIIDGKTYYVVTKNRKQGLFDMNMKPITDYLYNYLSFNTNDLSIYNEGRSGTLSVKGEAKWEK